MANEKLSDLNRSVKSEIKSLRLGGHCGIIESIHELHFDEHNLIQLQHLIVGGFAFEYCRDVVFTSRNRKTSKQEL